MAETDAAGVQRVYENLMRGSRNHLRAFVSTLERRAGEPYEPQYLSHDAYEEIIAGTTEPGRPTRRRPDKPPAAGRRCAA